MSRTALFNYCSQTAVYMANVDLIAITVRQLLSQATALLQQEGAVVIQWVKRLSM